MVSWRESESKHPGLVWCEQEGADESSFKTRFNKSVKLYNINTALNDHMTFTNESIQSVFRAENNDYFHYWSVFWLFDESFCL